MLTCGAPPLDPRFLDGVNIVCNGHFEQIPPATNSIDVHVVGRDKACVCFRECGSLMQALWDHSRHTKVPIGVVIINVARDYGREHLRRLAADMLCVKENQLHDPAHPAISIRVILPAIVWGCFAGGVVSEQPAMWKMWHVCDDSSLGVTPPSHPPLQCMVMAPPTCFVPGCKNPGVTREYTSVFDRLRGLVLCPAHAVRVCGGTTVQQHIRDAFMRRLPRQAISGVPPQSIVCRTDQRIQTDWSLVENGEYVQYPAPFLRAGGVVYITLFHAGENVVKNVPLRDYLALNPTVRLAYHPEQDPDLSAPFASAWKQALHPLI